MSTKVMPSLLKFCLRQFPYFFFLLVQWSPVRLLYGFFSWHSARRKFGKVVCSSISCCITTYFFSLPDRLSSFFPFLSCSLVGALRSTTNENLINTILTIYIVLWLMFPQFVYDS